MKYTTWAPALVLAGLVAACEQSPAGPDGPLPQFTHDPVNPANPEAFVEEAWVCKAGVGSGTFVASGNVGGSLVGGPAANVPFDLDAGECVQITQVGGLVANVTVTETATSLGTALQSVDIIQWTGGVGGSSSTSNVAGPSATGSVGGNTGTPGTGQGVTFVFHNVNVPVFSGNSINVQTVRITPTLVGGAVSSFTGSFQIKAFDQAVTVTDFDFRISRNGEAFFWSGDCATTPGTPLNVAKSTTVTVQITPDCAVGAGPVFNKGDDVRLEVIATLATGRVFSNSGFFKIP